MKPLSDDIGQPMSIAKARQLIGDDTLSDEQVREMRDACYQLAEVVIACWKRKKQRESKNEENSAGDVDF